MNLDSGSRGKYPPEGPEAHNSGEPNEGWRSRQTKNKAVYKAALSQAIGQEQYLMAFKPLY